MAKAGDVITNPVTGERLVVLQTAQDTNGQAFVNELFVRPHGFVAAQHIHPKQEETFEVTRGTIRFRIEGKEADARIGQVVVIPAGTLHSWWNAGDEEAGARVSFQPALNTETFFETFFGLARDGKTDKQGMPNLLQTAVLASAYRDSMQLPLPPPAQLLLKALALLGRLLGYRASYPQYSSSSQHSEVKHPVSS